LFKSTDGGETWREITRNPGLPQGVVGKISIAISGADSSRVYALIENENGGLFSSDDAGATWKLVNTGRNIRQRAFYYTHVFADPNQKDTVYALNTSAFRSIDGGGGGGNQQPFYPVGGNEDGYIAPDPKDLDVFFSGANNGSFITRLNRRTGELREVNPYPRFFSGENSASVVERWQWTFPIVFSPVDPNVLYTSSQHVWKTTNGGQTWEKISDDLTRHDPKTMQDSGGPITHDMNSPEIYGTVFALAPGKTDVNVIWAGSDDGIVHAPRAGGKSWTNVTPRDMP